MKRIAAFFKDGFTKIKENISGKISAVKTDVREDFTPNSQLTVEQRERKTMRAVSRIMTGVMAASMAMSCMGINVFAATAVEGVALVLVSMFFAIQLCNDAMLLKIQSYEQVFKLFFKFIMAKVIVQNARGLMAIIFNGFSSLASSLGEIFLKLKA